MPHNPLLSTESAIRFDPIVLGLPDFEDAVQIARAIELELEAIVTRDVNGFAGSPIPVLSPQELRNRLL